MNPHVQKALEYCNEYRHPVTGFLHRNGVVPVFDNWLHVLALVASKQVENSVQAQQLAEKLLAYRNAVGNVPPFLHDYPHCPDRYAGVELLPIFYRLVSDHRQALGQGITAEVEAAAAQLVAYGLESDQQQRATYPSLMNIAAAAVAFGRLLNNSDWQQQGNALLDYLLTFGEVESWYIPAQLTKLVAALQMAAADGEGSPWQCYLLHAAERWDRELQMYVGPAIEAYYFDGVPQLSAYDCWMGGGGSRGAQRAHLDALVAEPLVMPPPEVVRQRTGYVGQRQWLLKRCGAVTMAVMEQQPGLRPTWKGQQALRCLWQANGATHSMVLQAPYWSSVTFSDSDRGVCMRTVFSDLPDLEDKSHELTLFISDSAKSHITVAGKVATTFTLEDDLLVESAPFRCRLSFAIAAGSGRFIGHLMPGQRPSERGEAARMR